MIDSHNSDDPLFDVLLDEALGGQQPPNLVEPILRALVQQRAAEFSMLEETPSGQRPGDPLDDSQTLSGLVPPVIVGHAQKLPAGGVAPLEPSFSTRSPRGSSRKWWPMISSVAAVVACIGLSLVWWQYRPDVTRKNIAGASSIVESNGPAAISDPNRNDPAPVSQADGLAQQFPSNAAHQGLGAEKVAPVPTITLPSPDFAELEETEEGHQDALAESSFPPALNPNVVRLDDQAVVGLIDAQLAAFWQEQGLTPTAAVSEQAVRSRIGAWLGATLAAEESVERVTAIRQSFELPAVRSQVALRVGRMLLGRLGTRRIDTEKALAFTDWLHPVLEGKPWGEAVSELLMARGSTSPQEDDYHPAVNWFAALAGPRSVPLTDQFAHSVLDVDVRCGRCHDHPLDGRVAQGLYWQLNAIFETGLRWSTDSKDALRVDNAALAADTPSPVVFYELRDGRQRLAEPQIPVPWLFSGQAPGASAFAGDNRSVSPDDHLTALAASLKQNRQVALAAVNRVWEMVYERPLVGSPANPSAAPESKQLVQLQNALADQFLLHDQDLARLISWVIAARPFGLDVPSTFLTPQFESAAVEEIAEAVRTVQGFAGYPASIPRQDFADLLAIADLSTQSPDLAQGTGPQLFGQLDRRPSTSDAMINSLSPPSGASRSPGDLAILRATLEAQTGTQQKELLAPWLVKVTGNQRYDRQAEHVFYLAGYWHPSPRQLEIAHALRQHSSDDEQALNRLWWILAAEKM
jgi:hypothetical protein